MRKTRLLSLMLVAAILLMGAGYALWHEDLKIDGKICTGELDFALSGEYVDSHCYADGSFVVAEDGHSAELKLSNMSPGEESEFEICIENTGTIGIVVEDVTVTATGEFAYAIDQIAIGSKSVEDYFTDMFAGMELEPGDEFCEEVIFYVDWEADEENFPEDICFDLLIEANVTQSCYEDYGEEPEPEPKCPVGLRFKKPTIIKDCNCTRGCNCTKMKVSGSIYYVYEDGTEEFAGKLNNELFKKDETKTFEFRKGSCDKLEIELKLVKDWWGNWKIEVIK